MNKLLIFIVTIISFYSCDGIVGESGVVENELTGERIENVEVKLTSNQGDKIVYTDNNGYYENFISYSCGLASCDDDYSLTFKKDGFQIKTIDETYYNDSTAEFVTEGTKDTLIVKLEPN